MNETKQNNFTAWEYSDVTVSRARVQLYKDSYENFGWIFIEQKTFGGANQPVESTVETEDDKVILKFKRDSRLPNKTQINQLQHKCERAISSIQELEGKKSAYKMGTLLGFGTIGGVFLGLAVYNFVTANFLLGAVSTVISLVGWATAFFSFKKVNPKKEAQINPEIEKQFTIVYQTCEQANALLS